MSFITNLRISARLAAAFGVLIALMVMISAWGAINTSRLAADLDATAKVDLTQIRTAGELQQSAGVIARASRELLIIDSAGQIKRQRELITAALQSSTEQISRLKSVDPEQAELIKKVAAAKEQFIASVGKFLTTFDAGNPDDTKAVLLIELRPVQQAYEKALNELSDEIKNDTEARAAGGLALAGMSLNGTIAFGLVALLIGIGAAVLISRSIASGLGEATAAARRIKAGDLSTSVHSDARDEIGELLRSMGDMQNHLTDVLRDVLRSARDVASSSDELSHGNAELSQRTERAAANLQQTASAMEQISSTVNGSSEKSREASGVASKARQAVIEGGATVERLVETMTRIAGSSTRIKDIISVIDGIAFQTNILALNAAVEAARAGDQGRGFAVVAGEVRTLAARAAAAAKEIKGLIDDSAERVSEGTQTVAEVGQRIKTVVGEVMNVRQLIEEVSVAGQEQASGMASVNGSVTELDQTTQQNAALVEEIAATASSLKDNARRLVDTVEFFRLPGQGQAA